MVYIGKKVWSSGGRSFKTRCSECWIWLSWSTCPEAWGQGRPKQEVPW